jgi:DNA repair protein RecO (recombination protein O)
MLHKTKAIVLNHRKYGDNGLIATLYTETLGRKAFLIQGFYSRKSKFHTTFFQPLTLLDLEADINPKRELQRIKEISFAQPFQSIPFNNVKQAITLFLAEILYKTLKEEESNPALFEYVYHTLQLLDAQEEGIANFHLLFLMHLTKYLGFFPIDNYSESDCVFDTVNGRFYQFISSQSKVGDQTKSFLIHKLLTLSFDQLESLQLNHQIRYSLLQLIIEFYQVHLGSLSVVKSLPVLQCIFEE